MECCEWQLLSVPHDQAFTMSMVEEWCQQPHIPFDSISYHMLHLSLLQGLAIGPGVGILIALAVLTLTGNPVYKAVSNAVAN